MGNALTPYLCVDGAAEAVNWYVEALGARVTVDPVVMDDGRIGHVELELEGARWMMSDEFESAGVAAPPPGRGTAVSLHLAVSDGGALDALAARVAGAGRPMERGPEESGVAGRVAVFLDPFGHRWFLNAPGGTPRD